MFARFFNADILPSILETWEALYAEDTEAHVFMGPKFLAPYLEANPKDIQILVAMDEDGIAGILPMKVQQAWSEQREKFITRFSMAGALGWAAYTGPVVRPSRANAALRAMSVTLAETPCYSVRFRNLRLSDFRQQALFHALTEFEMTEEPQTRNNGAIDNHKCPAIPLPADFDAYLTMLSEEDRGSAAKALDLLDAGDLSIRMGETRPDIEILSDLWSRNHVAQRDRDKRAARFASILSNCLGADCLSLPILMRGDLAIATLGNIVDPLHRRIATFVDASDPEVTDIPAIKILHLASIREAIDAGFRSYDFLRGNTPEALALGGQIEKITSVNFRKSDVATDIFAPIALGQLASRIPEMIESEKPKIAIAAAKLLSVHL